MYLYIYKYIYIYIYRKNTSMYVLNCCDDLRCSPWYPCGHLRPSILRDDVASREQCLNFIGDNCVQTAFPLLCT